MFSMPLNVIATLALTMIAGGGQLTPVKPAQGGGKTKLERPAARQATPARRGGRANLVYSLWDGMLVGTAGGGAVSIKALSGGGGGSTTKPSDPFAVNNPVTTDQKAERGKGIRGGPIPPGEYTILAPGPSGAGHVVANLIPRYKTTRSGFQIHGRGPLGSDGCIVPLDQRQFSDLIAALTKDSGGVLRVVDASSRNVFR